MATRQPDEALVQLAMRVPQALLRRLKVYCVQHDVSMQAFIAEAIRERLRRTAVRLVPLAMSVAQVLAA